MEQQQHKCNQCGKSFNTDSELREHEKTCKSGSPSGGQGGSHPSGGH